MNKSLSVIVTGIVAMTSSHAMSQEVVQRLEEVLVTAQKREQRIIDVPYAVTAVSGQEILDRASQNIRELQFSIPGLYITDNGPGQDRIQMRGVSPGAQGLPVVGVYLDELGVTFDQVQRSLEIPLVDMRQVEVLRGPQGTLYGQGSMSGTIKYVTEMPNLKTTQFSTELGVNNFKNGDSGYTSNAMINVPLIDDVLGLRLVAGHDDIPGWIDNSLSGEKDTNSAERTWVRAKALWNIGERASASLLWQNYSLESDGNNVSDPSDAESVPLARPEIASDDADLVNLILTMDFGDFEVVSSTGYVDRSLDTERDVTPFFGPIFGLPPFSSIGLRQDVEFETFTQELRLVSKGESAFDWTLGAYYRDAETNSERTTPSDPAPLPGFLDRIGTSPDNSESFAIFGEGTYAISGAFEATLGLRYFEDDREAITVAPAPSSDRASFNTLNPRFNLLYRYSEDSSAYATVSKGFRSGGFNADGSSYDEESLWNYEVGTKSALLDGRLTVDAAIFYSEYTDMQVQDVAPGAIFASTANTGEASGVGYELAAAYVPTDALRFDLTYSATDLSFDESSADKFKGDSPDFVPDFTASASLSYRFNWAEGWPGLFRVDYQYSDGFTLVVRNAGINSSTNAVQYLNARFGVEKENWQVYLEGKNLTDEDEILFPAVGVSTTATRPRPLSFGVTVRYQYN